MAPVFSGNPGSDVAVAPRGRPAGAPGAMRGLTRRDVLALAAAMSLASAFALKIGGPGGRLVLRDGWVLREDDLGDIA